MTTLVQVVYPNTSAFSGTAQLNEGPFFIPSVNTLIRCEVHGQVNFEALSLSATGVVGSFQLWSVQWVPHGTPAQDCVTTADGPRWLIRQQLQTSDYYTTWAPTSGPGVFLNGGSLTGKWAGQLAINGDIDVYLSLRAPTGAAIANQNLMGSIRFWWA